MVLLTVACQSTGCTLARFISVRLFSLSLCLTVNLSSRKIPGLNVYAQMQNEKEQEMMSPANPTEAAPSSQQDLVPSLEILDTEFNSRPIGKHPIRFDFCQRVAFILLSSSIAYYISFHCDHVLIVSRDSSCAFCCVFLRSEMVRSRCERKH